MSSKEKYNRNVFIEYPINTFMQKGRPLRSPIRQNIVELLFQLNQSYGYKLSKIYNEIFPKVTQRSIYYHLRKGLQTKEIKINRIEQETGSFSWGSEVEKKIYSIGSQAQPKGEKRVEEYLNKNPQLLKLNKENN